MERQIAAMNKFLHSWRQHGKTEAKDKMFHAAVSGYKYTLSTFISSASKNIALFVLATDSDKEIFVKKFTIHSVNSTFYF